MTEKSKRVDYEMKYIGWNIGATRIERHETKGGIEILELKIDGVDVLKQLGKAELWDQYAIYDNDNEPEILVKDLITAYEKLEAIKTVIAEVEKQETIGTRRMRATTYYMKILKILEGEK